MNEALLNAIRTLAIVGFDKSRIEVVSNEFNQEPRIKILDLNEGCELTILVTNTFWAYPGVPCYFVNINHPTNGNFMACEGTPFIEKMLMDLGAAMQMVPPVMLDD